jgi:hypothetical protein
VGLGLKLIGCVLIAVIVLRVGVWSLRLIAHPAPPPLPPGEMRKVNVRYRCAVCGMEMKVLLAPDDNPVAPTHCLEDMETAVAPYD